MPSSPPLRPRTTPSVHIFETFHEGWDYRERLEATLKHYRTWKEKAGETEAGFDPAHPALSETRPLFVDNRDATPAEAIRRHLRARQAQAPPLGVCRLDLLRPARLQPARRRPRTSARCACCQRRAAV
jgi:hypothetical protein